MTVSRNESGFSGSRRASETMSLSNPLGRWPSGYVSTCTSPLVLRSTSSTLVLAGEHFLPAVLAQREHAVGSWPPAAIFQLLGAVVGQLADVFGRDQQLEHADAAAVARLAAGAAAVGSCKLSAALLQLLPGEIAGKSSRFGR